MHAKVYIADTKAAVITSANMTQAGLESNLECGIELCGEVVTEIVEHFDQEWRYATEVDEADIKDAIQHLAGHKQEVRTVQEQLKRREAEIKRSIRRIQSVRLPDRDALVLELTPLQLESLKRPVRGQGGYQSLLRHLRENLSRNQLSLTKEDCERIVRYAKRYGQGGWQDRLASIARAAEQYLE